MNTLAHLKLAHSAGETIQARILFSVGFPPQWVDVPEPMWRGGVEYRVKPKPEPIR